MLQDVRDRSVDVQPVSPPPRSLAQLRTRGTGVESSVDKLGKEEDAGAAQLGRAALVNVTRGPGSLSRWGGRGMRWELSLHAAQEGSGIAS